MNAFTRGATAARISAAVLGVGLLTAVGSGVAFAATEADVDVSVEIAPVVDGALALTVAGTTTQLIESQVATADRVFTGSLPEVTVTDTRSAGSVAPGLAWYVMGSVTDFVGSAGQPDIEAASAFGWQPSVVSGDPADVAPGDPVAPGGGGFGQGSMELLYNASSSADIGPGAWTAGADLTLSTPVDVAPGSYSATLTLSLFEDDGN